MYVQIHDTHMYKHIPKYRVRRSLYDKVIYLKYRKLDFL